MSAVAASSPEMAEPDRLYSETDLESALRKNTWRLLPILVIAYFFNYIDRTSVGFAALQMNKDIGLTATQFGWGAGIMFLSYCLLEVPSNLAMYRFGARKWIGGRRRPAVVFTRRQHEATMIHRSTSGRRAVVPRTEG